MDFTFGRRFGYFYLVSVHKVGNFFIIFLFDYFLWAFVHNQL